MLTKTILIPDIHLRVVILTNTSGNGGILYAAVSNTIVIAIQDQMILVALISMPCI
jgi:hypothetical protein